MLPLVVIAVACGRGGNERAAQTVAAADSADQLIAGLKTHLTNEGIQTAYLEADSAFVYETRGHTDLKKIRVTFYTDNGVRMSVLTADSGWYRNRTSEMEARGNVVITRTDGARLSTSTLRYDQAKNQVSTTDPYVADQGDRHFHGTGFVSDPAFTNVTSQGVKGTAGRMTLPGQ